MIETFLELKEAYGESTRSYNIFKEVIDSIDWEDRFIADGEYYFEKKGMIFSTPSLDPFNMPWKPSALFIDGYVAEF